MTKLYIVSNYVFKFRPKHKYNLNKAFYKTLLLSITRGPINYSVYGKQIYSLKENTVSVATYNIHLGRKILKHKTAISLGTM